VYPKPHTGSLSKLQYTMVVAQALLTSAMKVLRLWYLPSQLSRPTPPSPSEGSHQIAYKALAWSLMGCAECRSESSQAKSGGKRTH
jgi:hypothetical protein